MLSRLSRAPVAVQQQQEEEENREEAAVDLSFELTPDAFPDLSDDAARIFNRRYQPATAAPTARAGPTASAVAGARQGPFTREDFPALGGGARGGAAVPGNIPAFRHAVAPYQSRAALLHNDRDQWAYPKVEIDRKGKGGGKGPKPSTAAPPPPPPSSARQPPPPPPPPTRDLQHEIVQLIG